VGKLSIKGPSPTIFDINFLSSIISEDPDSECFIDASALVEGPIETSIETDVLIQWPKDYKIHVFVRVVLHSLTAKIRLKFGCKDELEAFRAE